MQVRDEHVDDIGVRVEHVDDISVRVEHVDDISVRVDVVASHPALQLRPAEHAAEAPSFAVSMPKPDRRNLRTEGREDLGVVVDDQDADGVSHLIHRT
ncbi:hypothetical protein BDB13_5597 [Rhodococcus sp. OK302]|nr:hypothetical protein BDB13_5597 [Rhodococcus sp. OK302]